LRYNENWEPQPYLAEKWEISKDGLSVTLHLVKDATFHDGKMITSEDVAFSVATVQKYHPFKSMFASVARVDTPDAHIAIIRLKRPNPAILLSMSPALLPIIPKHVYGDGRDIRTHPANRAPVGSGPFKLVEFITDKHILLERYEGFFLKGRPYLDRIRFNIFLNVNEIPAALEVSEVHMINYFSELNELNRLSQKEHLIITSKGHQGIGALMWLAFNLRKKPLDDLRVRHAIAYVIDRDFITQKLLKGKAKKATGPINPDSPFYSDAVDQYGVDFKKANELLDAAGYPRDKNGKRFTIGIDLNPENTGFTVQLAEYLRLVFIRSIGVELKMRYSSSFSEWADRISNWNFELILDEVFNWGDPIIGVHRTYASNNIRKGVIWSNTQNYRNPKVDALMEAAGSEMNFEKRKALYAEFQKILVHDLPVFWLMKMPYFTVHHKDLMGIDDNIWGVMSPLDKVYWLK
jgi:peptide/nickel transport system substrate-binding protein